LKLSIQTLFLPRESLPYMEEWLVYHTLLGFDEFRLYDNTGSAGDISSPFRRKYGDEVTKYGIPNIPKSVSDERISEAVKAICSKFAVEIIPWPSPHFSQRVLLDSIKDHCSSDDSDYTAFIDMDEYICVGGGKKIKEFIKDEVECKGFCGVRISQQKMPHILKEKTTTGRRVWEITETFQMETRGWAPKNILPTKYVTIGGDIHTLSCRGRMLDQPDRNLIKINHYNTNEYQMHWLKQNYMHFDRDTPFERLFLGQSHDNSLERFKEEMSAWHYIKLEEIL
jgi:hypothetical protein